MTTTSEIRERLVVLLHNHRNAQTSESMFIADNCISNEFENLADRLEAANKVIEITKQGNDTALQGLIELKATINEMEYRHECLKMMWEAEVNNCPPDTADKDIDIFIQEQESHS